MALSLDLPFSWSFALMIFMTFPMQEMPIVSDLKEGGSEQSVNRALLSDLIIVSFTDVHPVT